MRSLGRDCDQDAIDYYNKGDAQKALARFQLAIEARKIIDPHSLELALSYNNLGKVYRKMDQLENALQQYHFAAKIMQTIIFDYRGVDLRLAALHNEMGLTYYQKGDLDKAFQFLEFAKVVRGGKERNGLDYAESCNNIAIIYYNLGSKDSLIEALKLFEEVFEIKRVKLIPHHPDLLFLVNNISVTALSLGRYDLALKYINFGIARDEKYKYFHNLKGLLYHKQGNLGAALRSFDEALKVDPSYADALLNGFKSIFEIAKSLGRAEYFQQLEGEIIKLINLKETDFDNGYKAELESRALSDNSIKTFLMPKQQYKAQGQSYIEEVEKLKNQFVTAKELFITNADNAAVSRRKRKAGDTALSESPRALSASSLLQARGQGLRRD